MINHIRKIKIRTIILISYCLIVAFSVSCQSSIANREEKSNGNDSTRTQTKNEQSYENLPIYEEQLTAIGGKIGYLEEKNLKNALQAVGFVRVHNQDKASVTSLYGGKVQAIFITPGTMVKKGQLLATLANPQIISLQEEYLTLVNNLELTKIELLRQEELMQGNAGALKNLQNVKSKYALLGIRKASIQKQLTLAGINPVKLSPENMRETIGVTAPITGTVSNITIEIGGNADAGAVIANIINNAEVDLDLYVYEKDIDKIKIGQEIMFNLSNNPDKGGKAIVDKIGSSFEGENKSIAIHAQIAENNDGYIDGMGVNAILETGSQPVTAIPNDGVVEKDGANYIFYVIEEKIDRQNKKKEYLFKRARIKKGITSLGYTEIIAIDSIPQNCKVATSGAVFMQAKLDGGNTHSH